MRCKTPDIKHKDEYHLDNLNFPEDLELKFYCHRLQQAAIYNGPISNRAHVSFNRDNIDNTNVAQDILEIDANILTKTETDTSKLVTV